MSKKRKPSKVQQILQQEEKTTGLNITSMMDMFTIILLFLLHAFNATPDIVNETADLRLPKSTLAEEVKVSTSVTISKKQILVNDVAVANVAPDWTVAADLLTDQGKAITAVATALKDAIQKGQAWEKAGGEKFVAQLLIKADSDMDYTLFKKILYSAAVSGFQGYRLLVISSS